MKLIIYTAETKLNSEIIWFPYAFHNKEGKKKYSLGQNFSWNTLPETIKNTERSLKQLNKKCQQAIKHFYCYSKNQCIRLIKQVHI